MPDWRICRDRRRRRSRRSRRADARGRDRARSTATPSCTPAFAGTCRPTSTSPRSAARAGRARRPTRSRSASRHEDGTRTDFSYGELDARRRPARRRACAGSASARGDRVALVLPQRFETAVAHIALYRLGAVAMPLSMLFGPEALEYRLNDSEARLAIVDESGIANVLAARAAVPAARDRDRASAAPKGRATSTGATSLARRARPLRRRSTRAPTTRRC